MFNFNSDKARVVFADVISGLPKNVDLYFVGGSVRNALYREFHKKILVQRDYDQVITKGSKHYLSFLEAKGFQLGNLDRPTQKVFRKELVNNPQAESYKDFLVFDIHTMDNTAIENNLTYNSGFSINGFAISARDTLNRGWLNKIIALPHAIEDLKSLQLRVNQDGYKVQTSNLFAAIRFMSVGFKPPSPEEVKLLLIEQAKTDHERYVRGIQKVWEYAGGETNARKIVSQLKLPVDIFDETDTKEFVLSNNL